jgi:hypothetical protein
MINYSKIGGSNNVAGYVDATYPWRVYDAWGDVDKAKADDVWKADEWAVTATGTSPITASVLPGAVALITSENVDFAGDNIQLVGSRFKLEAGKPVYFGAKLTINEATQSDLVVGLFGVDTTLTAASEAHAIAVEASGVGFTKLDAVTAAYFKTFTTATEKNSASALTMDVAAHVYEIAWDGESLKGYIDGALVACFTEDIPTAVLTPSIAFRTGSTAAKTCTIHWVRAFGVRS